MKSWGFDIPQKCPPETMFYYFLAGERLACLPSPGAVLLPLYARMVPS
jgi:hypothetical protein